MKLVSRLATAFVAVALAGVAVGTGLLQRTWRAVAGGGAIASGGEDSPAAGRPVLATVVFPGPIAVDPPPPIVSSGDGVKVSTFLGDETRRVYGLGPPPKHLHLIWKTTIGSGLTAPTAPPPATARQVRCARPVLTATPAQATTNTRTTSVTRRRLRLRRRVSLAPSLT